MDDEETKCDGHLMVSLGLDAGTRKSGMAFFALANEDGTGLINPSAVEPNNFPI